MRSCYLILLNCLAAAVGIGAETTLPVRPEVTQDLTRAIELEYQGQLKEAERILLNLIRTAEASGSDTIELGLGLNNLAVLYITTDRYDDAERHFLRAIRVLQAVPGDLAAQVLAKGRLHLAALYLEIGRDKEAIKLDVPALLDTLIIPEDQARARGVLAGLAALRKDLNEAERIYTQNLSFWMEPSRAAAGQVEAATILNNLGVIALSQGRTDAARTRLEESLAAWRRIVGPEHPTLAKAMSNVAVVCMQAKQYDDAAMWLGRAEAIGRRTFGELHPFTVAVQFAHAEALKKAGRKTEASHVARLASEARKMMRSPSNGQYTVDYRDMLNVRPRMTRR